MRTFVGEFVCGGGFIRHDIRHIARALREEGAAMAAAICQDLAELGDVVLPLDSRFSLTLPRNVQTMPIEADRPLWPQWVAAARNCDAAIVIAPETDGILAQAVGMLRAGGVDVASGSGDFLRVASDKWETARAMAAGNVPHPVTYAAASPPSDVDPLGRWVIKPRDGCGTDRIQTFDRLDHAVQELRDGYILQSWVEGRPVSVSVIVSGGEMTVLPAVAQTLDSQTCAYAGGHGPLPDDAQRRAASLAACALAAMPPTARGFVGLDLILAADPHDDRVIELNPRLTTSYVGLRHMIEGNLAQRILGTGNGPVRCCVAEDAVRWTPNGHVWVDGELVDDI